LKIYFNQALGITIPDDECLSAEDDFHLSGLDDYRLKTEALANPLDAVIEKAEGKGWWPSGMFKEVSLNKFKQEGAALKEFLNNLKLSENDVWSVEFHEHCHHPEKIDQHHWVVPAIRLENVILTGKLDFITKEGLCCLKKGAVSDLFSLWPKILLLNHLSQMLNLKTQLLLLKEQKILPCDLTNSKQWLKRYVHYVLDCTKKASPLLPEWIQDIVAGEKLEQTLNKEMQNQFRQSYNKYLLWCLREKQVNLIDKEIVEEWKEKLFTTIPLDHDLFSKLKRKKHENV